MAYHMPIGGGSTGATALVYNSGTSASTTSGVYITNTSATSATTTGSIQIVNHTSLPTIFQGTSSTITFSDCIISDCNVITEGKEITEDMKIKKLLEMEEQLQKMKEALDEAVYMAKRLMRAQGNDGRRAALKHQFTPRIETIQQEAKVIVEEAEEVLVFR